jgi:hypothetical protein
MQVYAWMTDVELGTNTATQIAITTESSFDEREKGPVERIASRGLEIAQALTSIPTIGIFAKASAIVLSSVSSIASLFGWSKPVLIQDTKLVKNIPYNNGALTIGTDTNFRVVLDPKQELTVDPRSIGSDSDDMTISAIASRLSYLGKFTWAYNNSIMANPIFVGRVSPSLGTVYSATSNYIQPTALAFAVAPFTYWRGDITFRFEVVCSQYHRGKIAIFYEPNAQQMTLINANISFNKQFIRVIDIQQTQTFEVCVKWATYRAWLLVNNAASLPLNTSLTYTGTQNQGFCNGYIGIVPFTQLTSPSSTPSVDVNVYVRSDNMQVNGFTTVNMPTARVFSGALDIVTESNFSSSDEAGIPSAISAHDVSIVSLNDSSASVQHICEEHFGEQPISFRALLKRYVTHAIYTLAAGTTANQHSKLIGNIFPNNNLQYGATSVTYMNLYSYLRYAYVGIRGGFRFRFRNVGVTGFTSLANAKVSLSQPGTGRTESWAFVTGAGGTAYTEGTGSFVPATNGGVEAEFPFYTNNLWVFSFIDGLIGGASTDNMSNFWFQQYIYSADYGTSAAVSSQVLMTEIATAEDFSLLRFQGAPFYSAGLVS